VNPYQIVLSSAPRPRLLDPSGEDGLKGAATGRADTVIGNKGSESVRTCQRSVLKASQVFMLLQSCPF